MSQSEEETSGTDSPVIKSRPFAKNENSSEESEEDEEELEEDASEEDESEEDESEEEHEQQPEVVEKPVAVVKPKPAMAVVKPKMPAMTGAMSTASNSTVARRDRSAPTIAKSKTYDAMVLDAINALDENKRSGVSVKSVTKYVKDNMELPENFKQSYFKKAIHKGLAGDIYVHTSGTGMTGSIAFSTAYKKAMKLKQAKAAKAAEKKADADGKSKEKAKPKATKKPVKQKVPPKDKNNNPTGKAAGTKKSTARKRLRVSMPLMPAVKAKPRAKPKPKDKVDESKATTSKAQTKTAPSEGPAPSTKGRKAKVAPTEPAVAKNKTAGPKK